MVKMELGRIWSVPLFTKELPRVVVPVLPERVEKKLKLPELFMEIARFIWKDVSIESSILPVFVRLPEKVEVVGPVKIEGGRNVSVPPEL